MAKLGLAVAALLCAQVFVANASALHPLVDKAVVEYDPFISIKGIMSCGTHIAPLYNFSKEALSVLSVFWDISRQTKQKLAECAELPAEKVAECKKKATDDGWAASRAQTENVCKLVPTLVDILFKFKLCLWDN